MKKSEELKQQAAAEENDLTVMGIRNKALREQRSERFEEYLPRLEEQYDVFTDNNGKYTIDTSEYGTIDFFPKANKVLIRKKNEWIKPGLRWIINNLYKEARN